MNTSSLAEGRGRDVAAREAGAADGLWTVSGSDSALLRLSTLQLRTPGRRTPVTAITTPSAELFAPVGVAFDAAGMLWVTSQSDDRLLGFDTAALGPAGVSEAAVVITAATGSLDRPAGIAFDRAGRLWVANAGDGTLVRFDPDQLSGRGGREPAVTVCGLGQPTGLAFDASGSLWVSDDQAHTVVKYRASQLLGSGSPAPSIVLRSSGRSLASPVGLAFDESGALWVANTATDCVVAFAPGQLTTSGVHAPRVVLTAAAGSLGIPVALAFDTDGGLWVMGGAGVLEKFSSRNLSTSGAPAPSIRLLLKNHTLCWGMALWPVPARLPLGR